MNCNRLLERFLRYVRIDTQARDGAEEYPSSRGQLELGRLLVDELHGLGIADACQDRYGIVMATIPPTVDRPVPTVALCAHLDTSPETSGAGVKPQVIERYPGGDIALPGNPEQVIRAADNPELKALIGTTLVTSDGTTLLGADDKSGIAVIMEAAAHWTEHPELEHGPVRLVFTCDEEIGHGTDKLDLNAIGAAACYTLDGQGADTIDVETFSADAAVVRIGGVNIHPSIAKGRMTNAVRAAADFLGRLPRDRLAPEATDGREGFIHPYELHGGVGEVTVRVLLRDFDTVQLADYAELLRRAAAETTQRFPDAHLDVAVTEQYRNLADGLRREPRTVEFAEEALQQLGRATRRTIVRGGTDGSLLTTLGLPTPNLATGQHCPHSPLEWASLDQMTGAAEWLIAMLARWAE